MDQTKVAFHAVNDAVAYLACAVCRPGQVTKAPGRAKNGGSIASWPILSTLLLRIEQLPNFLFSYHSYISSSFRGIGGHQAVVRPITEHSTRSTGIRASSRSYAQVVRLQ